MRATMATSAGILPFVSVVTSVRNEERTISKLLDSLLAQDYPKDRYEILVVDAVSTDRTAEIVKEYEARSSNPPVRLLVRPGPDVAGGRNRGVREAKGEFVYITDGDMVVGANVLRDMVAVFTKDPTIGGVGGPNESESQDLVSRTIACFPVHGPSRGIVPLLGAHPYDAPFVSSTNIYASVCRNAMFRKSAMEAVGLFDESLIATEDPEFNARLLDAGYRIAYVPEAAVRHHHRTSLTSFLYQQGRYAYWQAVVNRKHPRMRSPRQWLPALALHGAIVFAIAAVAAPALRFPFFAAVVLALLGPLVYGLKCAVAKRDPALAASAPVFFLAWMLGWAVEYPLGALGLPGGRRGR
ncbi:MAG TPA: glycosyltransferase [Candidatus Thermoplasmatota archaeon]|nr:glycosyltransferase [Candidatus Thermoplasmatota archaeon]